MSSQIAPVGYTAGTSFAWNTRGQTIAAATVLPALGLISVALRIWSRFDRRTGFGVDDALIIPALICVIGLGITLLIGVSKDVIAHTTPANPNAGDPNAQLYQITAEQVLVEKVSFVFFLLTVAAYGFIKLSVLFFYRRIFVNATSRMFDIVTIVAVGITAVWTIAFFLLSLFLCGRHVDWNWGPLILLTKCVDGFKANNALFISDLLTDILVICLPIPLIFKLNMTLQRKFAIIGVLLLGSISIVAAVIRLVFAFQGQAAGLALPTDIDEGITTLLYWCMLEAGISLIATNLPSIYFLIRKESLRSFAASVRSTVSLSSLRLQRSNSDIKEQSLNSKQQTGSEPSNMPVAGEERGYGEEARSPNSFAMHDMKRVARVEKPDWAHTTGEVSQERSMV